MEPAEEQRARRRPLVLGCAGVVIALGVLALLSNELMSRRFASRGEEIAREMASRGYPATVEELIAYQNGPFEVTNGGEDLLAAFAAFEEEGIDFDLLPVIGSYEPTGRTFPLPADVAVEMDALIQANEVSLGFLQSALEADVCRIPMVAVPGGDVGVPLEVNARARNLARLLYVRALLAADRGDPALALESVRSMLRLGGVLNEQPGLISSLVGVAIVGMAGGAGQELIESSRIENAADLEHLASLLETTETGSRAFNIWTDVLLSEYRLELGTPPAGVMMGEIASTISGPTGTADGMLIVSSLANQYSFVGAIDRLRERELALLVSKHLDEPLLDGIGAMGGQVYDATVLSRLFLLNSEFSLSSAKSAPLIEAMALARLRSAGASARVAAWRVIHGRLPSEEEFTSDVRVMRDPYNGAPLRYAKTDTGFRVYAVGPNGIDEGGEYRPGKSGKLDDLGTEISFGGEDN